MECWSIGDPTGSDCCTVALLHRSILRYSITPSPLKSHITSFNHCKLADELAYVMSIHVEDIYAIGDLHAIFGQQVP